MGCCMVRKKMIELDPAERSRVTAILNHWFTKNFDRESDAPDIIMQKWQKEDPKEDEFIKSEFEDDLEALSFGQRPGWERDHEGRIATVIVFDQYARCMYRGTDKASSYNTKAVLIVKSILREGQMHNYRRQERYFFQQALQNSNVLEDAKLSVEIS